jgi:hypothetical protein
MHKATHSSLIATASTPTTTNTHTPPPAASSLDVTSLVITAAISAVLSGGVVGAILKIWSDQRLAKQQREHDEKMRAIEYETEIKRQKNTRLDELLKRCDEKISIPHWDRLNFYNSQEYKDLESYIENEKIKEMMGRRWSGGSEEVVMRTELRKLLRQELVKIKKKHGLL